MNNKKIIIVIVAVIGMLGAIFFAIKSNLTKQIPIKIERPVVGILLSDVTSARRWTIEAGYLREKLMNDGFEVELLDAHGDDKVQRTQVDDLVKRGAKGLIVVAVNADALGTALINAHNNGVKIIAYDRILRRGPVDRFVTVDMTKAGELEYGALAGSHPGAKFLYLGGDPADENSTLHRNGLISAAGIRTHLELPIMVDSFMAPLWDASLSYEYVSKKIAEKTDFSAVIAANDSLADSAIRASKNAGKKLVFVGGSDGDIDACARVRGGEQTVTIMKPGLDLAMQAVEILEMLMKGVSPPAGTMTDNGYAAIGTTLIAPMLIDKNNVTHDITKCAPK